MNIFSAKIKKLCEAQKYGDDMRNYNFWKEFSIFFSVINLLWNSFKIQKKILKLLKSCLTSKSLNLIIFILILDLS